MNLIISFLYFFRDGLLHPKKEGDKEMFNRQLWRKIPADSSMRPPLQKRLGGRR
jgi:hypothetical protein